MSKTYEAIVEHLKRKEFHFHQDDQRERISFGMGGKHGRYDCRINVSGSDQDRVTVLSLLPFMCPESHRPQMLEAIARANYGLFLGNFEMDVNDGELRYKTSIALEGSVLRDEMIKSLLGYNWSTIDRYMPAITKILFADVSAREAIASVEDKRPSRRPEPTEPDDDEDEDDVESKMKAIRDHLEKAMAAKGMTPDSSSEDDEDE